MNIMLEQFNLPRYIDGLSFADASKKIQSKFKERTDPESINTEKEMLDRLKQMQEHVKAQQEAQEEPERSGGDLVAGSEGMPLDEEEITQEYNQEQGAEEDLMSQIQSAYGGNQYAYGGPGEETPTTKANITSKVAGLTGIGTSPTNENMDFDTKQIVRYQPGVTSGQTGKKGFYLYSKNAGEPGFDPLRHREFVNQEEMMAVQRTPQWKSYMQGQSKMALGGDEEDLHYIPETAKQRFSPVIPSNDQSISSSIMSLAKTAGSFAYGGEDKKETNDFLYGGYGQQVPEGIGYAFGMQNQDQLNFAQSFSKNNPLPSSFSPDFSDSISSPNLLSKFDATNPLSAAPGSGTDVSSVASGSGPSVAGYAQLATTAMDLGKQVFGSTGIDTSGRSKVAEGKVGNAALSGAAKGAAAGMAFSPIGAGVGAVVGGLAGFIGGKRRKKAAAIANRNATYADAAVNDNKFYEGGEEDDKIKISDNRKIRATTRQRMDPNVDLVSGSYSSKTITDIVNASLKNGVDPDTAIALAMQESKIGNIDENLGHILGGSYRGEEANDMTRLLSEKMHAGRKLGRKTDEELLQMYNGTGKIFPSTEQEDHGFKMKKAYGVPVGKKGIDMGKTNLYGVQVKDIRDNVIKKDKKIASMVKDLRGNFNHFEGRPYSKADPRTYDDPLGIAPGARDNLNPKMFALGGEEMNRFDDGGSLIAGKINAKTKKRELLDSVGTLTPAKLKKLDKIYTGKDTLESSLLNEDNYVKESKLGLIKLPNLGKKQADKMTAMQKLKLAGINAAEFGINAAEFAGNNKDALRYAPTIGNIMQLANLKKPEQETTPELSTRYKKNVVDEQGLINLVREETAGNREAILSSSEGSGNAARANLLGTQLNATKALSDAFMKSQEATTRENAQEQSFNLGVDTTNLQQQTLAQDIRARNKGAYNTEKSRLKTAIVADLGGIGQEELYKKFPELMGSDYDWKGKYKKLLADQKLKDAATA